MFSNIYTLSKLFFVIARPGTSFDHTWLKQFRNDLRKKTSIISASVKCNPLIELDFQIKRRKTPCDRGHLRSTTFDTFMNCVRCDISIATHCFFEISRLDPPTWTRPTLNTKRHRNDVPLIFAQCSTIVFSIRVMMIEFNKKKMRRRW